MRQNLLRQPAEFTAGIRVHDGPKTGNRRAAAASAPEPQGSLLPGRSDTAGPGSHAAKIGRRKSPQRRSTAKNPEQKPPQDS